MEYEFIHDVTTGNAMAKFSFEHQAIGPWLEIEIGQNTEKLTEVLSAIDLIESGKKSEMLITGHEYSLVVNGHDVHVQANTLFDEENQLNGSLAEDNLSLDNQGASSCGVIDFRELLLSWAKFTKINEKTLN